MSRNHEYVCVRTVDVVWQVGKVEPEAVLDAGPRAAVEVGRGSAGHHLVLELGAGVDQQKADRLGELDRENEF